MSPVLFEGLSFPGVALVRGEDHYVVRLERPYNDVQAQMANQLSYLPNHQALCRLMVGRQLEKYSITTLPEMGEYNDQIAQHIRQKSAALGQAKAKVEADIAERIGEEVEFDIPGYSQ